MQPPWQGASADEQPMHVVALDDHAVVRFGLELLVNRSTRLRWSGSATTSAELFALLARAPCRLLVLDYELSPDEIDGWSLVKILRVRYPHVRIVVYTAHLDRSAELLMRQAGVHGFVPKGCDLDRLLSVLESVAAGGLHFTHEEADAPATDLGLSRLTPREIEVLRCCLQGMSMTDIARKFVRSVKTVSSQKHTAYRKLGIRSDYELIKLLGNSLPRA